MWYVPSSAADGLSAKTDNVLALIAARLPSLMEAEQKGGGKGWKLDLLMESLVSGMLLVFV